MQYQAYDPPPASSFIIFSIAYNPEFNPDLVEIFLFSMYWELYLQVSFLFSVIFIVVSIRYLQCSSQYVVFISLFLFCRKGCNLKSHFQLSYAIHLQGSIWLSECLRLVLLMYSRPRCSFGFSFPFLSFDL